MNDSRKNVAVLGASPKEDRYSNKAVKALLKKGYTPFPVHPVCDSIHGVKCTNKLSEITGQIDTVTMYLSEKNSSPLIDEILALEPRRLVINPGTENPALEKKAEQAGIQVERACTLVLLNTGQF